MKKLLSLLALVLAACSPAQPADGGADSSANVDSASNAKPTCVAIAERCHDLDGVNATATMCHRAVEAPTATESSCVALQAQCFAACPETDGGHSHGGDAAATDAHSHDEDAAADAGDSAHAGH